MSYNVDTIEYIGNDRLTIRRGDAVCLSAIHEDQHELPEGCLFDRMKLLDGDDPDEILTINRLDWYGEGSGSLLEDVLFDEILSQTKGHAQFIIIWEGGDSIKGIDVNEGVVTKYYEIIYALGEHIRRG